MKQTTHTWIAIRAIELIRRDPKTVGLAEILTPWVTHCHVGCWLPDMPQFKKGHGLTQNHTFKMAPYDGDYAGRFVLKRDDLLAKLDPNTDLHSYLLNDSGLDDNWWERSFKAEQPDGQHLADCLSSLYDTIMDLILLGDTEVDEIVPGDVSFADDLHPNVTINKEQISTFFFMMSHYIADAFMPLHCDGRPLAAYKGKSHKQWEEHWDTKVGEYFSKESLLSTSDSSEQIIDVAKLLDDKLGLSFTVPLTYNDDNDVWETAVFWCRGSFALASNVFPEDDFPYEGDDVPTFGGYLRYHDSLDDWNRIILQSAVYSVAGMWKKIWRKFKA